MLPLVLLLLLLQRGRGSGFGLPCHGERDDAGHGPLLVHGLAQRLHGLRVGLAEQRGAVDVDQLVVGAEAAVARGGAAVQHALDEDAEVDDAATFAAHRRAGLSLDADAQPGQLAVVHGDVEGEDLALPPGEVEASTAAAVLIGPPRLQPTLPRPEWRGRRRLLLPLAPPLVLLLLLHLRVFLLLDPHRLAERARGRERASLRRRRRRASSPRRRVPATPPAQASSLVRRFSAAPPPPTASCRPRTGLPPPAAGRPASACPPPPRRLWASRS